MHWLGGPRVMGWLFSFQASTSNLWTEHGLASRFAMVIPGEPVKGKQDFLHTEHDTPSACHGLWDSGKKMSLMGLGRFVGVEDSPMRDRWAVFREEKSLKPYDCTAGQNIRWFLVFEEHTPHMIGMYNVTNGRWSKTPDLNPLGYPYSCSSLHWKLGGNPLKGDFWCWNSQFWYRQFVLLSIPLCSCLLRRHIQIDCPLICPWLLVFLPFSPPDAGQKSHRINNNGGLAELCTQFSNFNGLFLKFTKFQSWLFVGFFTHIWRVRITGTQPVFIRNGSLRFHLSLDELT